jgi:hypothetical protein
MPELISSAANRHALRFRPIDAVKEKGKGILLRLHYHRVPRPKSLKTLRSPRE